TLKSSVPPAFAKPKAFAAAASATSSGTPSSPDGSSSAQQSPAPKMSAAAPPQESPAKPSFKIDPMMAEQDDSSPAEKVRKSFSDLNELPPLKEVYVASTPPPAAEPESSDGALPQDVLKNSGTEKPKIQVREAAQKAVSEIKKTPPKLYLYGV